jgi:hypothetical protein
MGYGRVRVASAIAIALFVAGCTPAASLPSEREAREFLDEAVSLAAAQRFEELCELGGGSCRRLLGEAGDPPLDPPSVTGTRTIPRQTSDGVTSVGGLVLELCGVGQDGPYYTEMLVFRDGGALRAIEPIYWSGFGVAADGTTTGSAPSDPADRCPAPAS